MRIGSVEFFKVLIKTVLTILFFVPLIIAVIFGVFLLNKNKELKAVKAENVSLETTADILIGQRAATAEDLYNIFEKSGVPYDDLMKQLFAEGKLDSDRVYNILSNAGVEDKVLIASALNKNGSDAEKLRELLKSAGLTDAQIAALAAQGSPSGSKPESASGNPSSGNTSSNSTSSNDPSTVSTTSSVSSGDTPSTPQDAVYMSMYEDLYVPAPTEYVEEKGTVYLTFDDGPSVNTNDILTILRRQDVKATFFVVPNRSKECMQMLKRIADAGHSIGVHSFTHEYSEIYASVEDYLDDFYEAWDIIRDATGIETQIFRFAGGSNNDFNVDTREAIIAEMTRRGFRFYDWNIQSNGILNVGWTEMYNRIPKEVNNAYRSIILFHDTCADDVKVTEDIIKVLKQENKKFDKINNDTKPIQFVGPFSQYS